VVFAAPSGERHELGLLGAAVLTAAGGFGTVYLGPDLPADDIWDAAARADARLVVVSLTAPGVVTRAELRALARVPPGARLWVGGPASRELLAITAGDTAPRVEHIESLAGLPAMLERHAR
jgi:MerR family transcriptional regulator, light-induced transcriptional regulator